MKGELGNSRAIYLNTAFQRTQAQIPHSLKLDNLYVHQYTRHVKWVPVTTERHVLGLRMEETAFRYVRLRAAEKSWSSIFGVERGVTTPSPLEFNMLGKGLTWTDPMERSKQRRVTFNLELGM